MLYKQLTLTSEDCYVCLFVFLCFFVLRSLLVNTEFFQCMPLYHITSLSWILCH